jgi:hypothetical protein
MEKEECKSCCQKFQKKLLVFKKSHDHVSIMFCGTLREVDTLFRQSFTFLNILLGKMCQKF